MLKGAVPKKLTKKAPTKVAKKATKAAKKPIRAQKRSFSAQQQFKQLKQDEVLAGIEAGRVKVYPKLEEFADVNTIRETVQAYHKSFALKDEESPLQGFHKLIRENGTIPFVGFLFAAMISKEIFLTDPGAVNLVNTLIVSTSFYCLGKEGIKKEFNEFVNSLHGRVQDSLKVSVQVYEAGIKHCQAVLDKPSIIRDSNQAFQEAHDALTEARVRVDAQKHKDAVLGKLNLVANQEAVEAKAQADAVRSEAMSFLQANAFSDKVKAEVMDEALSLVGQKTGLDAPQFKALQNVLKQSLEHAQKAKK